MSSGVIDTSKGTKTINLGYKPKYIEITMYFNQTNSASIQKYVDGLGTLINEQLYGNNTTATLLDFGGNNCITTITDTGFTFNSYGNATNIVYNAHS